MLNRKGDLFLFVKNWKSDDCHISLLYFERFEPENNWCEMSSGSKLVILIKCTWQSKGDGFFKDRNGEEYHVLFLNFTFFQPEEIAQQMFWIYL